MRAVRVGEPGTVTVTDVPEPRLHDPRDAVVKVTIAAICGADLFPIHGMTPGFDDATVLGDAGDLVAARTGGMGADVVIEAAGTPQALDAALRLARGRGTVSVVGAHFEHDYKLDAGLMFERELTLRFSIGDPISDRERLMRLILDGKLEPERVISHRMPLEDAARAYQLFDQRIATKAVLYP